MKISSQGVTGPEIDYGSLGSTLEQTAGLASVTGYEDGVPLMTNGTFPDPVAGILAVGALMAALRRRRKTGRGTLVDLSQREVPVTMLGEQVLDYSMNGRVAGLMGNRHQVSAPQGVYPCQGDDTWLAISVGSDEKWEGLCRAIGRSELVHHPRFETVPARRRHQAEMDQIISDWTRGRDHRQAMHLLQAQGVPAGAVLKGSETIADPHLAGRGFWDRVEHPEGFSYKQVTTPWHLSKSPRRTAGPSPGLGEHNGYVLGQILGLSDPDIAALEEQGVIGTRPADAL